MAGPRIEPGTPATLVRSSTTELPCEADIHNLYSPNNYSNNSLPILPTCTSCTCITNPSCFFTECADVLCTVATCSLPFLQNGQVGYVILTFYIMDMWAV